MEDRGCADSVISVEKYNSNGHSVWAEAVYQKWKDYIKKYNTVEKNGPVKLPYKTTKISNRRYLGYKLLPFITKVVAKECKNTNTVADIFAGTGAVTSAFTDKKLITNDDMYSNYICHTAWFGSENYSEEKVIKIIGQYNAMVVVQDNYMKKNFANTCNYSRPRSL